MKRIEVEVRADIFYVFSSRDRRIIECFLKTHRYTWKEADLCGPCCCSWNEEYRLPYSAQLEKRDVLELRQLVSNSVEVEEGRITAIA